MAMFGIIVSGRLVQTEFQQISETQLVTTINDADNINHIVVFLTGVVPFPEGMGGQGVSVWDHKYWYGLDPKYPLNSELKTYWMVVWLICLQCQPRMIISAHNWPDPNAPPNWQPLGFLSNQKPSAIFRISTLKKLDEMGDYSNMMFGQSHIVHNAQIGISIEPLSNIQDVPSPNSIEANVTFAQKMLENFMNFVLSYTITQSNMVPDPTATYVPLSTVQNWYRNFERRLQQNPNFWKS